MEEITLKVSFITPAILGGADQKITEWRTPPFKALLRQWWRVAVALEEKYNHEKLLERESALFGSGASANGGPTRSKVRLRLSSWEKGKQGDWQGGLSYLSYGLFGEQNPKKGHFIVKGESNRLWIAYPKAHHDEMVKALRLLSQFGSIGSKTRNGWGALNVEVEESSSEIDISLESALNDALGSSLSLEECLKKEWPCAFSKDDRGLLIWQTESKRSWKDVMRMLQVIREEVVKGIKESSENLKQHAPPRIQNLSPVLFLGFPRARYNAKGHNLKGLRIPNPIRFKVIKESNGYRGLIYHLPYKINHRFNNGVDDFAFQLETWKRVHQILDSQVKRIEVNGGR